MPTSILLVEYPFLFGIVMLLQLLLAGLYSMALKQLRGDPISVMDIFGFRERIGPLIAAFLLIPILTYAGFFACIVGAFLVQGLLVFTVPLILDRKLGPIVAMKLSIETLKSQMWMALGVHIVLGLVAQAGMLACGVGLLVSVPIYCMANMMLYQTFFWQTSPQQTFLGMPPPAAEIPRPMPEMPMTPESVTAGEALHPIAEVAPAPEPRSETGEEPG